MSTKNLFTIERLLDLPSTRPVSIDLTVSNVASHAGQLRKRSYDSFSVGESIESDKDFASGDEGMYADYNVTDMYVFV